MRATTEIERLFEDPLVVKWAAMSAYPLFQLMHLRESIKPEERAEAQDACREVFRRFAPRLLAAARKWEYLGPEYDADLLTSETILKAYRKAETFHHQPQPDPEKEDEKVLIWLFRILHNLIMDFCRVKQSRSKDTAEAVRLACRNVKSLSKSISRLGLRRTCLHVFMLTVSQENADLLRTSYRYYNDVTGMCEMPNDVREGLCRRLEIEDTNLRVRRGRLIARMKVSIQDCQNRAGKYE